MTTIEIELEELCEECQEELTKPKLIHMGDPKVWERFHEEARKLQKDCRIHNDGILLAGDYWIELSRANTAEKILSWVCHLSEKTWVHSSLLRRFVIVASEQIGIDPHELV